MPETPEIIVKEYTPEEYTVVQKALKEFHEREAMFLDDFDGDPESELEWEARVAQQRLENFRERNSAIKIALSLLNKA